ncbi:Lipoate-protein ligase LplJ [uncultured Roseburia sp.]|uniref:lipoate--protein ligase n=1 Tax=Brotonthovivens ammoniilytica TaxID=2981725 RepID=A0ABT2TLG3_9FIRM|nr:lipoate--protein ligase [Brotonthovivens ammoniilytica]MCU6762996.1 lipoate--protein ligase [Brotonthovivens ammoniilytica]SCI99873.1 Lipoate-protein ligase LplJ [uncultured Roseburia sp.]
MIFIESPWKDAAYNLALEQYVFDEMPKNEEYFMLWQNANAIVVGKHQNTVEEINIPFVKEHGIQVVRRLSGGGAVYHDLGNINFTFIADAGDIEQINLQAFCRPVVSLLKRLGVFASITGRNDITVDGRKFSGNSQYIKQGRIMHHGTLLFDSDLSVVGDALKVSKDKIASKGFQSVRSRVTNLKPYMSENMTVDRFQKLLKENMLLGKKSCVHAFTETDKKRISEIKKERYDTWEWNYGYSPEYSIQKQRRIDGVGKIELFLTVKNGIIESFDSRGDYFGDGAVEELKMRLKGMALKEEAVRGALLGIDMMKYYSGLETENFVELLLS